MNSIGAVSPAARATATMVAVTIPPTAVGRITVRTVRVREAPSAMLPSRSVDGTSSSTSSVARAINGSMMIASAIAAAKPLWPRLTTTSLKMNMPITMVGTPASTFSVSRIASANRCGANSVLKIASSTPIGTAIAVAISDDDHRADDRVLDAAA